MGLRRAATGRVWLGLQPFLGLWLVSRVGDGDENDSGAGDLSANAVEDSGNHSLRLDVDLMGDGLGDRSLVNEAVCFLDWNVVGTDTGTSSDSAWDAWLSLNSKRTSCDAGANAGGSTVGSGVDATFIGGYIGGMYLKRRRQRCRRWKHEWVACVHRRTPVGLSAASMEIGPGRIARGTVDV
ncbi:MAG TPA: hypothetical protein DFR83_02275 [Deltaproteobacteria bacterium]|nr:hypothetical protein [Deltaproteobacteria bacterium]